MASGPNPPSRSGSGTSSLFGAVRMNGQSPSWPCRNDAAHLQKHNAFTRKRSKAAWHVKKKPRSSRRSVAPCPNSAEAGQANGIDERSFGSGKTTTNPCYDIRDRCADAAESTYVIVLSYKINRASHYSGRQPAADGRKLSDRFLRTKLGCLLTACAVTCVP